MKECQFHALLTIQRRDDWIEDVLVERICCTIRNRQTEFRTSSAFPLLFPETHERVFLAELCKNCGGAGDGV